MEEHLVTSPRVGDGDDEGLSVGHDGHVGDETGVEYVMQGSRLVDCVIGNAPYPSPWSGPGYMRRVTVQRIFQASVRTERRMPSISSNSFWPEMSGGASCTTGSPRSSARQ